MVAHACNPSTGKTEADESQVQGQLIVKHCLKNKTTTLTTKQTNKMCPDNREHQIANYTRLSMEGAGVPTVYKE